MQQNKTGDWLGVPQGEQSSMKNETIPELRERLRSASPEEAEKIALEIIEKRKQQTVREERKKKECQILTP